jgi:hypothetical protein
VQVRVANHIELPLPASAQIDRARAMGRYFVKSRCVVLRPSVFSLNGEIGIA